MEGAAIRRLATGVIDLVRTDLSEVDLFVAMNRIADAMRASDKPKPNKSTHKKKFKSRKH